MTTLAFSLLFELSPFLFCLKYISYTARVIDTSTQCISLNFDDTDVLVQF